MYMRGLVLILIAQAAFGIAPQSTAPPVTKPTPLPTVGAPVNGPGPMFPGLREVPKGTEPADLGYETKEYFVSGTANEKPYATRILVRQPKDAKKFSGNVVAEVMHGSG